MLYNYNNNNKKKTNGVFLKMFWNKGSEMTLQQMTQKN